MPTSDERQRIRDAMDRLLDGAPIRSCGSLTIVSLAEEADVKRHVLTHRHTDLKDEFYAKVRTQGHVPKSEQDLRAKITTLEQKITELRNERDTVSALAAALRRMNNVLGVENQHYRDVLAGRNDVTPLHAGTVAGPPPHNQALTPTDVSFA